jgi:hypothetical protein
LEGKFEESRAQILLLTEENKALKLMKDVDQEIPNNEVFLNDSMKIILGNYFRNWQMRPKNKWFCQ